MMRARVQHHRRGYVLILTLGLLVLSAALMASLSRAALRHASDAREAAENLQRRVGITSCRLAVLPAIEAVLNDQERAHHRPAAMFRTSVRLGEQAFDLVLADEQAKANLNVLLDETDAERVETRLREQLAGSGIGHLVRVRALPKPPRIAATSPSSTQPIIPQRVTGYGQIFDNASPQKLLDAAELLTFWGDGLINVRRASESAMKLAATPALSGVEINRLIQARTKPTQGASLLTAAGLDRRAGLHVTETSRVHSLWIVARSSRRQWVYFTVLDQTSQGSPASHTFVW